MAWESGILLELPIKVTAHDGTTLWEGNGMPGQIAQVVSSEASTTIIPGHAVVLGNGSLGGYVVPWDATARAKQSIKVKASNSGSSTTKLFFGVALTKAAPGERLLCAIGGSIVPVKSLASASLASNTFRALVIASTTVGTVNTEAVGALGSAATDSALGRVAQIAGTTGGTTDSGSDTQLIVLVNPV